jgi:ABC-2 type transport system ATP-binding protein
VLLPGVEVDSVEADGRLITFSLDGAGVSAADLVAYLAGSGGLRDISVQEPAIEDVIARLYARAPS